MWKKDEMEPTTPTRPGQEERAPGRESPRRAAAPAGRATIGPSITIRGEVSGDEDLLIQGRVDGSVDLKLQSVTVGSEGRVKANISGRVVTVEGAVEGDLRAQEQVILRSSARVQGDITAPRVVLEDGASFRGLVDMGEPNAGQASTGADSSTQSQRAPLGTTSSSSESSSNSKTQDSGKSSSSPSSSSKPSSSTSKDTASVADKASSKTGS